MLHWSCMWYFLRPPMATMEQGNLTNKKNSKPSFLYGKANTQ